MCSESPKDSRNAIPSWSGYIYQGQIAIVVALETIIENKYAINECEIGLEDLEDFSIYNNGVMVSTHQVKATAGKKVSSYSEALYYMAKSLQSDTTTPKTIAYLHTREELDQTSWEKDVKDTIEKFVPNKQNELRSICADNLKLSQMVTELKKKFKKNKNFKTSKSSVWREIYKLMDDVETDEDITKENLKVAIETYLDSLQPINLSKDKLLQRIKYYKYSDNNIVKVENTRTQIEELIKCFWGDELSNQRKGSEASYRWRLQEIVDQYVVAHHIGDQVQSRIKFNKIVNILSEKSMGTEEYSLLRNKDMFFLELEKYCKNNCISGENCELCDLYEKKEWFSNLTNRELKNAFYLMSPDKCQNIAEQDIDLLHENGLAGCYFYILSEMKESQIKNNSQVTYVDDRDAYMLTDLFIINQKKKEIYEGLARNDMMEKICDDILNNREIALERMDIDAMIAGNIQGGRIEIEKLNTKILQCEVSSKEEQRKKDLSYLKITNKKNTILIDAEQFLAEHEEMRRKK